VVTSHNIGFLFTIDQALHDKNLLVARQHSATEILSMKSRNDLRDTEHSLSKTLKRAIRKPRKNAPATEELRGWAKSAIKSRNKS
jgi:hypothetical protein